MLGAPLYARLAERAASDPDPAAAVLGGDASGYAALRLFGAVHYLVLTEAAPDALSGEWDDFTRALDERREELTRFLAAQDIQTNEVQRCVGLLPCFLTVAQEARLPVELVELGPSAGLNLLFDHYGYRYACGRWGPAAAEVVFDVVERAPVPAGLFAAPLVVRRRRGIDLAPIDVTNDEGVLLLRAFVWPGRDDRVARLNAAVRTLRREGRPELITGDYVELLPGLLAKRPEDAITVVFQTASTGYVGTEGKSRLRETMARAGGDGRPLAWVSTRPIEERVSDRDDSWEVEVRVWPAPARHVARLDFHGNWLEWLE